MGNLRLRTAYGQAGIQPSNTAGLATITFTSPQFDGATVSGAKLGQIGNYSVKPEIQRETEFGFDADLFKDRLHIEGTKYNRHSTGALINVTLPSSSCGGIQTLNYGSVDNSGYEGLVNMRLLDTK